MAIHFGKSFLNSHGSKLSNAELWYRFGRNKEWGSQHYFTCLIDPYGNGLQLENIVQFFQVFCKQSFVLEKYFKTDYQMVVTSDCNLDWLISQTFLTHTLRKGASVLFPEGGDSRIKLTGVIVGNFQMNSWKVPEIHLVGEADMDFYPWKIPVLSKKLFLSAYFSG